MTTDFYPFNPSLGQVMQGEGNNTVLQSFLAHYRQTPAVQTATAVHAAITLADGESQTITTGITNPAVPRNITIKGGAASMAGNVVINGTNMADEVITETIALNETTEVVGAKAFKTVTSIVVPARTTAGDTVTIGMGIKLGLPHKLRYAGQFLVKLFDGAADSGTIAVSATALESNTYAPAGTMNGAKYVDLFYMVG